MHNRIMWIKDHYVLFQRRGGLKEKSENVGKVDKFILSFRWWLEFDSSGYNQTFLDRKKYKCVMHLGV